MEANDNSSITHIDPIFYRKLRDIVNYYTQNVNRWLQEEQGGDSSRLVNTLAEIIVENSYQEKFFRFAATFNLSMMHNGNDLPSTIFYNDSNPYCQKAADILIFHCLILKKLIAQEKIRLLPAAAREPYYPAYDQWLIAAADKAGEYGRDDAKSPINFAAHMFWDLVEANSRGQSGKGCPICGELLLFKDLAYKSIRDSRIRRVSKFPSGKVKPLSANKKRLCRDMP